MSVPIEDTVILITRNGMGDAEPELQRKLIKTYLSLLVSSDMRPGAICFYTDGVKLAVEGSNVLDELGALEAAGVRLVLCRTCLEYFGLLERVQVGIVGGMTDIVEAQMRADKVIAI